VWRRGTILRTRYGKIAGFGKEKGKLWAEFGEKIR